LFLTYALLYEIGITQWHWVDSSIYSGICPRRLMARRVNRFNVENRAHRILEREKPTPAPKFDSNLRDMERTLECGL